MANEEEFLTFEQALDSLRLKEEELKRLVSEGEIRAFRQGETMRLRRADVDNLRNELSGSEVHLGEQTEEIVFEDDAQVADAGMATEEIAEVDTLLDEDVEDVGVDEVEVVADEDEEADAEERAPRRVVEVDEGVPEGGLMRAVLIATSVLLIAALPVVVSQTEGRAGDLANALVQSVGKLFD